jgi:hypothetical protein
MDRKPGGHLHLYRRAFVAFLAFLDENLAGRTSLRVDPDWGSQAAAVQGFAAFAAPDILIRETTAAAELPELAHRVGLPDPPPYMRPQHVAPFSLAEIYDTDLERAARAAYARDYMVFGFGDWAD